MGNGRVNLELWFGVSLDPTAIRDHSHHTHNKVAVMVAVDHMTPLIRSRSLLSDRASVCDYGHSGLKKTLGLKTPFYPLSFCKPTPNTLNYQVCFYEYHEVQG